MRVRASLVAILSLCLLVPAGAARSAPVPSVTGAVRNVEAFWEQAGPGEPRYPLVIAYDGRVSTHVDQPSAFAQDTYTDTTMLRLRDLSADAATDAVTSWWLRGTATPIKLRTLNDLGVDFHVADAQGFGTTAQFGQGAVHDLYWYGAAAAGSQAVEGNVNEDVVINDGMPIEFPDRPASASPAEGRLTWEMLQTLRTPTSTAVQPDGSSYSTTLVADIATPYLRVEGGDLTQPASADPFSLTLAPDVLPLGALSIQPSGLPGVGITSAMVFPDAGARDFHHMDVNVAVDPAESWPESASEGAFRQWMWHPIVMNYGIKRSGAMDAGTGAMVQFEAPLPAGSSAVARSVTGEVRRIGPNHGPGTLQVLNVGGHQALHFVSQHVSGVTPFRHALRAAETTPSHAIGPSQDLSSPEVRRMMPAGAVTATLTDRETIPVLANIALGDRSVGDVGVPSMHVVGATEDHMFANRVVQTQVVPFGFGGRAPDSFHGAGFTLQWLMQRDGVMVEVAIVPTVTNFYRQVNVYVLDVHPIDDVGHEVTVDTFSKPAGGGFTANGQAIPVETLAKVECNGDMEADNRPDIQAVDTATGTAMRYFLITPTTVYQGNPEDVAQDFALLVDHGSYASDPQQQVDGEPLTGPVALYDQLHFSGLPDPGLSFRSWLQLNPV